MSAPLPLEQHFLLPAELRLEAFVQTRRVGSVAERRMQAIEAVAARLGGFDLLEYHDAFDIDTIEPWKALDDTAGAILDLIKDAPMHPSLALAALARERLSMQDQRKAGAHYTDFRLAAFLGGKAAALNRNRRSVIDPAAGSGILLVATAVATCGSDRKEMARFLADRVVAADLSAAALRGARLSLASLTGDLGSVRSMTSAWYVGDSLLRPADEWQACAPTGFGAVIGNPPWEKLKVHRHEEALANGRVRHYGAVHADGETPDLLLRQNKIREYARSVASRMQVGGGEVDLFAGFTQLMMELAENGGMAVLLPAGLIRSRGTEELRRRLLDRYDRVGITIFDNRARFFAIDTRFKFLAVTAEARIGRRVAGRIALEHGLGFDDRCSVGQTTEVPVATLRRLRPDMTVPEIKDAAEWRLYLKMAKRGVNWQSPGDVWYPEFCREVDMTRERRHFLEQRVKKAFPLVEGRMVHQHRFGAKIYVNGTGRKAIWDAASLGSVSVRPQFWIDPVHLSDVSRKRAGTVRAAFCDIAGQTNERSMLAAVVPAGSVCGNKVPTVLFPNSPGEESLYLWCGMVNSMAFDWLLRRVLTTTVNYFLLQSVPLPPIVPGSLLARRIVEAAKRIVVADVSGSANAASIIATARRDIDLICLRAYGLDGNDLELIARDFQSIDRSQPALPSERRSTVTVDFLMAALPGRQRVQAAQRHAEAERIGAIAYVPSQVELYREAPSTNHTLKF
jgi:hypothetical protein